MKNNGNLLTKGTHASQSSFSGVGEDSIVLLGVQFLVPGILNADCEGLMTLQNKGNHTSNSTLSHPTAHFRIQQYTVTSNSTSHPIGQSHPTAQSHPKAESHKTANCHIQ
jgi:hypothetical protein